MLFELLAAAIVGVFGSCVYSMVEHFFRDLNER
jgi:nitrate reductase NapE component